jgi:putative ATPase
MNISTPLAERLRPTLLHEIIGQEHLTGNNSMLSNAIKLGKIPSMILWGPPGVGKTTIANIIAQNLHKPYYQLSAINSGVKEVREIIEQATKHEHTILFIDEIHRFNKNQQDALLGAVEKGIITLIGATTENPSFEVNSALLSRMQVYVLNHLSNENLIQLLHVAIQKDMVLKEKNIILQETEALLNISGGDARKLLNLLELVCLNTNTKDEKILITNHEVLKIAQKKMALYDKQGEQHYDIISAFIKSMRGSDPNGAVYWLARMIDAGEDIKFIARRMLIFASEDIGNANPNALLLANTTFDAVHKIGYPEGRIILSQCAIYLATSAKSNSAYLAIDKAINLVQKQGNLPVPLHLRNAPTSLMKNLNYGKDYQYSHLGKSNFIEQEYLPLQIKETVLYEPGANSKENELRKFLKEKWKEKYNY